jgi:hypothetical protein
MTEEKKKSTKKYKFRNSELIELLHKHMGNISDVARELRVARSSVYRRINQFPELQKVKLEEDERHLDRAEKKMYELCEKGHVTALIFTLKTKGRHRGWAERHELAIQAQIEAKTGGVRKPVDDAKYLGSVLSELRKMGLSEGEDDDEIIEGELADEAKALIAARIKAEEPERITEEGQVEEWDKG